MPGEIQTVALVGPPNSGKTTLFNRLTGMRQKVANYPGVTVEQKIGRLNGIGRGDLTLIDLPGIYSFDSYSEDARVAVDVLHGKMPGTPKPDAVLLVLDSLHLTRQLMLAAPILALGLPTLVLLNMTDLMEQRGGQVDPLKLAQELGCAGGADQRDQGHGPGGVNLFLNQQSASYAVSAAGDWKRRQHAPVGCAGQHEDRLQGSALRGDKLEDRPGVLLHRVWGPLLFLAVVIGVFQVVFTHWPAAERWLRVVADQCWARTCARSFPTLCCSRC